MRRASCLSLLLVAGLLAPGAALADADAIKQGIADYLKEAGDRAEDADLSYKDLTVEPDGPGYLVSLTGLQIANDDGLLVDLGDTRFSVQESTGDYLVSNVSLPPSIVISNAKEPGKGTLTWTLERLTGTWSPTLEEFKALDGAFSAIALAFDEGEGGKSGTVQMGDLALKVATQENGAHDWDQQSSFVLGPVDFKDPEGQGSLAIAQVSAHNDIQGLDPVAYLQQLQDIGALQEAHEAKDEAKVKELTDALLAMQPVAHGLKEVIALSGLSFVDLSSDSDSFEVAEVTLTIGGNAPAEQKTGTLSLGFDGKGFALTGKNLTGEDKLAALLAPHDWTLDLEAQKLPLAVLNKVAMEMVFATVGTRDEPDVSVPDVMEAMGTAGSEVLLRRLSLVSEQAQLEGEAKATVDPTSAFGAVGTALVTLAGVEKLEAAVGDLPAGQQQQFAGILVFLKGLGKPETRDGAVVYSYAFDVPADGNVTLNGQPLGALMGGGAGGNQ